MNNHEKNDLKEIEINQLFDIKQPNDDATREQCSDDKAFISPAW